MNVCLIFTGSSSSLSTRKSVSIIKSRGEARRSSDPRCFTIFVIIVKSAARFERVYYYMLIIRNHVGTEIHTISRQIRRLQYSVHASVTLRRLSYRRCARYRFRVCVLFWDKETVLAFTNLLLMLLKESMRLTVSQSVVTRTVTVK